MTVQDVIDTYLNDIWHCEGVYYSQGTHDIAFRSLCLTPSRSLLKRGMIHLGGTFVHVSSLYLYMLRLYVKGML